MLTFTLDTKSWSQSLCHFLLPRAAKKPCGVQCSSRENGATARVLGALKCKPKLLHQIQQGFRETAERLP